MYQLLYEKNVTEKYSFLKYCMLDIYEIMFIRDYATCFK